MKQFLLSFFLIFTTTLLFAQTDLPYAEKAAQLQKDIWSDPAPEFKNTTVPANLAKEGAVVLARSYNLQRSSTGKFKFMIITSASTTHTEKVTTFHERVKLNDKASLEAFSTLSYQKKLDKTVNRLLMKFVNLNNTYIGAKIIKPDGKEIIVNTSEEVLLRNDNKDQQGKLAIPGLEVGDILDYYVSNITVDETMQGDSYKDNDELFVLADEYPVLYYSLDFQFNKKTHVRYIYGNGAPHLAETTDDAGDQIFSIKLHDIPKYESQVWTSPLRQYPYIEIGSEFYSKYNSETPKVRKDADLSRFESIKQQFEQEYVEDVYFLTIEQKVRDHFKSNKEFKNAPADTLAKLLYDQWKYLAFDTYSGNELENLDEVNYRGINVAYSAKLMGLILTYMKVDYDIILVASRNSNSLENAFNSDDLSYMIRINGNQPTYMAFDNVATHFNEIPLRFQGEHAVALIPERHNQLKYSFTEENIVLPVTPVDKNNIEERLQVSLLPDNMQKLKVDRLVLETGGLKYDDQMSLIPVQTVDKTYMDLAKGDELKKRLADNDATRKMKNDYAPAFQVQADAINKRFTEEIKNKFDQDPEKVENCKIIDPALDFNAPVFQYSSSFVLNNLVKKAGENYIIDAGKLTGSFYKLEPNDRKRTVDIYMTCTRSFKYIINITIPQGYQVKGMDEMTVKKVNKTGMFSSSATVSGNVLTITVDRAYNDNFEKVEDWPLVTELLDVASNFNTQKILLEKK